MRDLENKLYEQELEAREEAHQRAIDGNSETFVCACGQRQRVTTDADEYPDAVKCEICERIMRAVAPMRPTNAFLRPWLDNNRTQNFDHTREYLP